MFDFIGEKLADAFQALGDLILYNVVYKMFYYLEIGLLYILSWLERVYRVFTGLDEVSYNNTHMPLFDVFFQNKAINGVFIGMAAIGVIFAFVSAIIQVVRKAFDLDESVKSSMGQILGNLLKSILIILTLNVAMIITTSFVDSLMSAVDYEFDNAYALGEGPAEHYFTEEEYAAMGRIFSTIGNYSLNPSYKNRYSINTCYNEIRPDLKFLANRKVFDFYYETRDKDGNIVPTWQSVISNIANAEDYNREQPVDVYNEGIANALSDAMTIIKSDANIEALEYYKKAPNASKDDIGFDRIVFVAATMGLGRTAGAKNDAYNVSPAMNDAVRQPYYTGAKDMYDLDQVNQDLDISIFKTNYIVAFFLALVLGYNMLLIILTAIARIFNMLFLYVIAPPIVGLMPLDGGGKFKQWLIAFIVQTFSIFATIISMRIYLIFVPIVLGPNLILFDNVLLDMLGKVLILYGGMEAINKANGILTGILADSAGWQSVNAGDMGKSLSRMFAGTAIGAGFAGSVALGAAKLGGRAAWGVAKPVLRTGGSVLSKGVDALASAMGVDQLFGAGGGQDQDSKLPEKAGVGASGVGAGASQLPGISGQAGGQPGGQPGGQLGGQPGGQPGSKEGSSSAKTPPPMRDIGIGTDNGGNSGGGKDGGDTPTPTPESQRNSLATGDAVDKPTAGGEKVEGPTPVPSNMSNEAFAGRTSLEAGPTPNDAE